MIDINKLKVKDLSYYALFGYEPDEGNMDDYDLLQETNEIEDEYLHVLYTKEQIEAMLKRKREEDENSKNT